MLPNGSALPGAVRRRRCQSLNRPANARERAVDACGRHFVGVTGGARQWAIELQVRLHQSISTP